MGKLFKKNKPTSATYFTSESQRKKTSRLSFIHGSPQLVAVISVLVLASLTTGLVIVQKQKDSKAASQRVGVSFSKSDPQVDIGRWNPSETGGAPRYGVFSKDANGFTLGFNQGSPGRYEYGNGYRLCYNIQPEGSAAHPGLVYHNVRFTYRTNEAGTNGAAVFLNGQQVGLSEDRKLNGNPNSPHEGGGLFDKTIVAELGNAAPGSTVSFCNIKIGGSTPYFSAPRSVNVYAYTFGGSFDQAVAEPQNVQIIGTVKDNTGKGIPGVQISNCIRDDIRTDTNGIFSFEVPYSNGFCVRTGAGLDPNKYAYVRATNNNESVGKTSQVTYEFQVAGIYCAQNNNCHPTQNQHDRKPDIGTRETGFSFVATLKPTPAAPTPAAPTPSNAIIDQNRWSGWGFPLPENPKANHTIEHGNDGKLTINFDRYSYADKLTGCWTTVVAPGNTATDFAASVASNDAGRNIVLFRATGNSDKVLSRATNGKVTWNIPNPVQPGGSISVCNKVENPNNQAFDEKKTLAVSSYTIHGTGSRVTDSAKPSIRITSHETGSPVSGIITLKADAADASGITYVEFKQGGNILSRQLTAAPYQYSLDTTKYPDGDLKLLALARDNAGNFNSSNEITLKVNNTPAEPVQPRPASPPVQRPAPITQPQTTPSPSECSAVSSVEAENGIRKNLTGVANDPLHPDIKAAVLFTTGSYVECTLSAPETGRYAFGATIRSADFNGIAEAKISLPGSGSDPSRIIKAPASQVYGLVRFNEIADYRQLNKGQKVVGRVTFTNDARGNNGGDRNLWVDNMTLVRIPDAPATPISPISRAPAEPSAIVPCNATGSVEAERGSLYRGATVQTDDSASGKSMVRLKTNAQYVECTLKAPSSGKFVLAATVKSDNLPLQGRTTMQLGMAGHGRTQTDSQPTTGKYDRIRMRVAENTVREMPAGESVVVRISVTNASNNIAAKKHLLVDSIELIRVPDQAPPQRTPANPESEQVFRIPIITGGIDAEEVSYNQATGTVNVKVEAEKASYRGTAFPEALAQNASNNSAVRLWSNKNYVEYNINFPVTDFYSLDFAARSENYDGTAEARMVLDGKKVFGDDVKLRSSPKHNYYQSEKKVLIEKGQHVFKVEFTNDKRGGGGDRNLIIDYLKIRGTKKLVPNSSPAPNPSSSPIVEELDPNTQTIEAEHATWCRNTGKRIGCEQLSIPDSSAYGSRALVLNKKTDFVDTQFIAEVAGTYSIGATLKSMDYKGSAKADIFVDNDRVASDVTPSSVKYKALMYSKKFNAGSRHRIRVAFKNDLCGQAPEPCNPSNDRNLLVDQLRLTLISATQAPPSIQTEAPAPAQASCSANPNRRPVNWPVKPFNQAHIVRATFGGEPRGYVSNIPGLTITTSNVLDYLDNRIIPTSNAVEQRGTHHGIDIVAPDNTPVYSIQDGFVSANRYTNADTVRVGQFEYTHLKNIIPVGTQVKAFETVLGYITDTSEHLHLTYFINEDSRTPLNPLTHLNLPGYCDQNSPQFPADWLIVKTPERNPYATGTGGPVEIFVEAYDVSGNKSPYNGGVEPKTGINRIWATIKENGNVVQTGIVRDFNRTTVDPQESIWVFSPTSNRVRAKFVSQREDFTKFEYRLTRDKPLQMNPGSIYNISVTIEDAFGNQTKASQDIQG